MPDEELKQKLLAILSADVKDYSRLMSQDRVGTIATLKSHRSLFSDSIKKYGGRVIDNPGDEILAAFESVSDTVNCAVELQREFAERNAEVPSARMMQWRIGISLGEVIEEEGRIYGDGVNIAARIQSLTDPAGVCVSGAVYDQVKNKLGFEYESLGEHEVKNIPDPVRIYRILSYPDAAALRVVKPRAGLRKTWRCSALVATAILGVAIGATLFWNYVPEREALPMKTIEYAEATAPSKKPSVAVLPFDNMSNDPEQEYFSDGIAEQIRNGLAKNPGILVSGKTSSSSDRIRGKDIRMIGQLLNVTHVLEGSVMKSDARIRVIAQLIATDRDIHIWSEQYDRKLTEVFEIQDDISGEIVKALNLHLLPSDGSQTRTQNMDAYDAYLLGHYWLNKFRFSDSLDSFNRATSLDPNYADAYGGFAIASSAIVWMLQEPTRDRLPIITEYISKALSLDPAQPEALIVESVISFFVDRNYQRAINSIANLLKTQPSNHNILTNCVFFFLAIGRDDLALRVSDRFVSIDPLNPRVNVSRGRIFLMRQQFGLARKAFERKEALGGVPNPTWLAEVGFLSGDKQGIQDQLSRKESEWGSYRSWRPCYEAAVEYLKGDSDAVRETLAPLWRHDGYIPFLLKSYMAALEDDADRAIDYYSQALSEPEYVMYSDIHVPGFISRVFPDYRSHPKYQKMLKDVGLDEESIAKLKIPPLPF